MSDNYPEGTVQRAVERIERTYPEAEVDIAFDEELERWGVDVTKDLTCISDYRTTRDVVSEIARDEEDEDEMVYTTVWAE